MAIGTVEQVVISIAYVLSFAVAMILIYMIFCFALMTIEEAVNPRIDGKWFQHREVVHRAFSKLVYDRHRIWAEFVGCRGDYIVVRPHATGCEYVALNMKEDHEVNLKDHQLEQAFREEPCECLKKACPDLIGIGLVARELNMEQSTDLDQDILNLSTAQIIKDAYDRMEGKNDLNELQARGVRKGALVQRVLNKFPGLKKKKFIEAHLLKGREVSFTPSESIEAQKAREEFEKENETKKLLKAMFNTMFFLFRISTGAAREHPFYVMCGVVLAKATELLGAPTTVASTLINATSSMAETTIVSLFASNITKVENHNYFYILLDKPAFHQDYIPSFSKAVFAMAVIFLAWLILQHLSTLCFAKGNPKAQLASLIISGVISDLSFIVMILASGNTYRHVVRLIAAILFTTTVFVMWAMNYNRVAKYHATMIETAKKGGFMSAWRQLNQLFRAIVLTFHTRRSSTTCLLMVLFFCVFLGTVSAQGTIPGRVYVNRINDIPDPHDRQVSHVMLPMNIRNSFLVMDQSRKSINDQQMLWIPFVYVKFRGGIFEGRCYWYQWNPANASFSNFQKSVSTASWRDLPMTFKYEHLTKEILYADFAQMSFYNFQQQSDPSAENVQRPMYWTLVMPDNKKFDPRFFASGSPTVNKIPFLVLTLTTGIHAGAKLVTPVELEPLFRARQIIHFDIQFPGYTFVNNTGSRRKKRSACNNEMLDWRSMRHSLWNDFVGLSKSIMSKPNMSEVTRISAEIERAVRDDAEYCAESARSCLNKRKFYSNELALIINELKELNRMFEEARQKSALPPCVNHAFLKETTNDYMTNGTRRRLLSQQDTMDDPAPTDDYDAATRHMHRIQYSNASLHHNDDFWQPTYLNMTEAEHRHFMLHYYKELVVKGFSSIDRDKHRIDLFRLHKMEKRHWGDDPHGMRSFYEEVLATLIIENDHDSVLQEIYRSALVDLHLNFDRAMKFLTRHRRLVSIFAPFSAFSMHAKTADRCLTCPTWNDIKKLVEKQAAIDKGQTILIQKLGSRLGKLESTVNKLSSDLFNSLAKVSREAAAGFKRMSVKMAQGAQISSVRMFKLNAVGNQVNMIKDTERIYEFHRDRVQEIGIALSGEMPPIITKMDLRALVKLALDYFVSFAERNRMKISSSADNPHTYKARFKFFMGEIYVDVTIQLVKNTPDAIKWSLYEILKFYSPVWVKDGVRTMYTMKVFWFARDSKWKWTIVNTETPFKSFFCTISNFDCEHLNPMIRALTSQEVRELQQWPNETGMAEVNVPKQMLGEETVTSPFESSITDIFFNREDRTLYILVAKSVRITLQSVGSTKHQEYTLTPNRNFYKFLLSAQTSVTISNAEIRYQAFFGDNRNTAALPRYQPPSPPFIIKHFEANATVIQFYRQSFGEKDAQEMIKKHSIKNIEQFQAEIKKESTKSLELIDDQKKLVNDLSKKSKTISTGMSGLASLASTTALWVAFGILTAVVLGLVVSVIVLFCYKKYKAKTGVLDMGLNSVTTRR